MNTTIVRGICKVMGTTLLKYKDPSSQLLVRNLLIDLLKHQHDDTIPQFSAVIKGIISKDLAKLETHKAAKGACIALGWLAVIFKNSDRSSSIYKTEQKQLIEHATLLYYFTLLTSNKMISEAAETIMYNMWQNTELFNDFLKELLKQEPNLNNLMMLMLLVRYDEQTLDKTLLTAQKTTLITNFVKAMITTKVKPPSISFVQCQLLLQIINEAEFQKEILPALQKAMLRSPEISLQAVGYIVEYMNFDISPYALQMGKVLVQNLYSKDDDARHNSVESLKKLSLKCSENNVIEDMFVNIFNILNGSEGKITVVEYRINLLQVSFIICCYIYYKTIF